MSQSESGIGNIEIGLVLKLFVEDTHPPKEKIFIIVGITDDSLCLATVYINSRINDRVNWSNELKALQILLRSKGRGYLRHDSYADCSKLYQKDTPDLQKSISDKPHCVVGKLTDEDLSLIKSAIVDSRTIKGKDKKKFGFYG